VEARTTTRERGGGVPHLLLQLVLVLVLLVVVRLL